MVMSMISTDKMSMLILREVCKPVNRVTRWVSLRNALQEITDESKSSGRSQAMLT